MVIEMLQKTSIYVLANAPFIRENIVYHTASSKLMFVFFFSFWHLLRYRHKIPSAQYKVRTSLCHTKFESRNRHRVEKKWPTIFAVWHNIQDLFLGKQVSYGISFDIARRQRRLYMYCRWFIWIVSYNKTGSPRWNASWIGSGVLT